MYIYVHTYICVNVHVILFFLLLFRHKISYLIIDQYIFICYFLFASSWLRI